MTHVDVKAALKECGGDEGPYNNLSWCNGAGAVDGPAKHSEPLYMLDLSNMPNPLDSSNPLDLPNPPDPPDPPNKLNAPIVKNVVKVQYLII